MKWRLFIVFSLICYIASAQETVPNSIYDFKVTALNGGVIDLSQYKGKKILIVNTTTDNDRDRQFAQLEALYQQHKDKLVIIGFLSRDFATPPGSIPGQYTGPKDYRVSFPLAAKVLVRTDNMAPIYKWLTQKKYNKMADSEIKTNFQKYLINESGALVAEFDPKVRADNPKLVSAIEQ